jgi:hypothetical protein
MSITFGCVCRNAVIVIDVLLVDLTSARLADTARCALPPLAPRQYCVDGMCVRRTVSESGTEGVLLSRIAVRAFHAALATRQLLVLRIACT